MCKLHCDLISHSLWVHLFRAASASTKSSALVLFGYPQTALNADATFEFRPHTVIYFENFGLMTVFEVILLRYDFQAHQWSS